jgi:hypothetical protein
VQLIKEHVTYLISLKTDSVCADDEWWNFEERVHHDNFNVPSVCRTNYEKVYDEEPRTWQQIVRAAFPPGVNSLMFREDF